MGIPDSLKKWRDSGGSIEFEGDQYFVHVSGEAASDGAGALIVHGFPGSSWDWSGVVPHVAERTRVVVPDMLGYGMSDKPADGNYSIFKSAEPGNRANLTLVQPTIRRVPRPTAVPLDKGDLQGVT